MKKIKQLKQEKDIIFKSDFLRNFSLPERSELINLCHERAYKEGEYIFYKNDPGTGMYFIGKGEILLTQSDKTDLNDNTAESKDGFILGVSDYFGALSISYAISRDFDIRRKSNAISLTDTTLYGFFESDFEVLKERHPQIAVKFLESLNNIAIKHMGIANSIIKDLTDKNYAIKAQFDSYYQKPKEK